MITAIRFERKRANILPALPVTNDMKNLRFLLLTLSILLLTVAASAQSQTQTARSTPAYDAELAKRLGADERGMKMYVLCILKTGPKDAEIKGKERENIFAGHFANIGRLAEVGKLAVAGPFEKNDKAYRGLYIFNVATLEEAEKLVVMDPAVKAGIFVPDLTLWYGSAAMMATNDIHKRITKPKQ